MSRIPPINSKHKVCVICEGYEDYHYFKKLISLKVWDSAYEFITINAKSASNVFARYQDAYNNNRYEIVLVFCDTDKAPYREYAQIKQKINSFHNGRYAAGKLIIFANPCTMQIILSHFGDVSLKNQGKRTNREIVFDYTGVENYDAHEDQILEICGKISRNTYLTMKNRVALINHGDQVSGSTNFIEYLNNFENDSIRWIQQINKYLTNKE